MIKFPECSICGNPAKNVVYGDRYTGNKVIGTTCELHYDCFAEAHHFETIKLRVYNLTGEIIGIQTFKEKELNND